MPYRPKRPCRAPGCRGLCEPGDQFCLEHKKQQMAQYNRYERDKDAQAFYNSAEWRGARERHRREHPLCEECLRNGMIRPATLVDHIIPIRQGGARLDDRNLQSLCDTCHNRKSIEEGSRFAAKSSTKNQT